ncbi:ribonuclease H-like domain-containing protein [Tanacetum coccineum]
MTQLAAYTDADWAGCPTTHRSASGYYVFLVDNLLSWSAKRHATLSRYNVEAEYREVANVVAETARLRNLLHELHAPLFTATLVYCDNVTSGQVRFCHSLCRVAVLLYVDYSQRNGSPVHYFSRDSWSVLKRSRRPNVWLTEGKEYSPVSILGSTYI